jgi:hypothetical protein
LLNSPATRPTIDLWRYLSDLDGRWGRSRGVLMPVLVRSVGPFLLALLVCVEPLGAEEPVKKRVAALVTEYRHNSHADVIVSRLLLTDTLDGKGPESPLKLVSLYTDQKPKNDISRLLAASHRFPIMPTIAEALTLGTGKLAVDGVLLVAEHGEYPFSKTGNHCSVENLRTEDSGRSYNEV